MNIITPLDSYDKSKYIAIELFRIKNSNNKNVADTFFLIFPSSSSFSFVLSLLPPREITVRDRSSRSFFVWKTWPSLSRVSLIVRNSCVINESCTGEVQLPMQRWFPTHRSTYFPSHAFTHRGRYKITLSTLCYEYSLATSGKTRDTGV